MKLYRYRGGDGIPSISPPCLRIELALSRMQLPYEAVDLRSPGQVRAVNPEGRLPALEIDGTLLGDSTRIMDELERRYPDRFPAPAEPLARVRDRVWEHLVNDHLYWIGYAMRWNVPENRERMLERLFGRAPLVTRVIGKRWLRRSTRQRLEWYGFAEKPADEIFGMLARGLDMLDAGLAGGPFLEGRDEPGRGDLAAASTICQTGFGGVTPQAEPLVLDRPALVESCARVFEACGMAVPRWIAEHRAVA